MKRIFSKLKLGSSYNCHYYSVILKLYFQKCTTVFEIFINMIIQNYYIAIWYVFSYDVIIIFLMVSSKFYVVG